MPIKRPRSSAENVRRRRAREARFRAKSVALMNDTKWRELFLAASRLELWFMATFVDGNEPLPADEFDRAYLRSPLPPVAFERHHIGDWDGMCGPYKNILWILFPRRFFSIVEGGRKLYREQRLDEFLVELSPMGQLPLEITDRFVRVFGYKSFGARS